MNMNEIAIIEDPGTHRIFNINLSDPSAVVARTMDGRVIESEFELPADFEPIECVLRARGITVWGRVDPTTPTVKRRFRVVSSGKHGAEGAFVGTVFHDSAGNVVSHVFDMGVSAEVTH